MQKLAFIILIVSFLFVSLPMDVFAEDGDDDDDWYSQLVGYDFDVDYNEFLNYGLNTVGLIFDTQNPPKMVADYLLNSIKTGDFYPNVGGFNTRIDNIKIAVDNGTLDPVGVPSAIKQACTDYNISYKDCYNNTYNYMSDSKGYDLVPVIYYKNLPNFVYFSSAHKVYFEGYFQQYKISSMISHPWDSEASWKYYGGVADVSNLNFVFRNAKFYNNKLSNDYYMNLYGTVILNAPRGSDVAMITPYNQYGQPSIVYYNNITMHPQMNYIQMGFLGTWSDINWLVTNDEKLVSVPVFRTYAEFSQYMSGNSLFYISETLKDLKLPNDFDYDRLSSSVFLSIQQSDIVTASDLQLVINQEVTSYLEYLGINTKDILLSLQLGLIDNITNESYLKQIRDAQIVSNQKFDELITLIQSGLLGIGGGSTDITPIISKLDEIITLLGTDNPIIDLPSPPIDGELPQLDDLKQLLNTKFPFSIITDIELVVLLFRAEPIKPNLNFEIQLPFTDSPVTWYIDLVWFDNFRDYWLTFVSIAFMVFLLAISLKIIDSLKE